MSTLSVKVDHPDNATMLAEWLSNIQFVEEVGFEEDASAEENIPDWLTPEMMEMIDREVEKIENGTAELGTHEDMMKELREDLAQFRKERQAVLEYV